MTTGSKGFIQLYDVQKIGGKEGVEATVPYYGSKRYCHPRLIEQTLQSTNPATNVIGNRPDTRWDMISVTNSSAYATSTNRYVLFTAGGSDIAVTRFRRVPGVTLYS